jgi:Cof subfamily protein (haloacid dehalogenase superfamily)
MRDHRPLVRPTPELPIELVALDIDGTLVGEDLRLSDRTVAAIGEAVRRGVRVSLATGRRPSSAMDFANRLGLTAPVVGHQGAAVRAMPARQERRAGAMPGTPNRVGRLLHHRPLAPEVILDVLAWCRANGLEPHVNDLEQIVVWAGDPTFEDYSAYLGVDSAVVPDLDAAITHAMSKVISVGVPPRPMELVEEARRVFAGRADATVSHPRFLEFVAPGVSKGRAVAWLAHRAGIPMGRVMAIGDALNDVEMIADAGHGAAMATAPIEVRRVARYVAAPVAEDGVAALIEALVLAPRVEAARSMRRLAEQARDTAS